MNNSVFLTLPLNYSEKWKYLREGKVQTRWQHLNMDQIQLNENFFADFVSRLLKMSFKTLNITWNINLTSSKTSKINISICINIYLQQPPRSSNEKEKEKHKIQNRAKEIMK